ncbi:hypothetical protein QFZ31_005871 [Neobacillus niacini]|uniref:hypothetical protein n=1 Tax=Neobacillus driksii TaxID=3035913 RepID=UPI00277D6C0B|nr:hypothetical protein [Neobacillus niacini]MDQ0975993.1 hypothetical protein [Neobacillus niacini]
MKMNNVKSYAIIPNVAFSFGTKYHLNKDEFMLFAHLQFMKQIGLENTTVTMVDMLVKGLRWETSTKSRDKNRVVDALEGLKTKGYISFEHEDKILKDILVITINKEMEKLEAETKVEWKENPFVWKGFTKVKYVQYNLAENNGHYLMAICYTMWRENAQHKWRISIKEWEGILGVTDKTAREILIGCEKFIAKISGSHYRDGDGKVKQEANQYTMQTVSVESNIQKVTNETVVEKALDKAYAKVTDENIKFNSDLFNQIFDKKTKWQSNGYKAWKETTCPFVKEGGQKKIDAMRVSKKKVAGEVADRLEREYQEYLSEQKQQSEWMERQMARHNNMDDDEWISSYKPKEKPSIDNTYFLED